MNWQVQTQVGSREPGSGWSGGRCNRLLIKLFFFLCFNYKVVLTFCSPWDLPGWEYRQEWVTATPSQSGSVWSYYTRQRTYSCYRRCWGQAVSSESTRDGDAIIYTGRSVDSGQEVCLGLSNELSLHFCTRAGRYQKNKRANQLANLYVKKAGQQ